MLDANFKTTATLDPIDYQSILTLAMLALETSEHPIAKNSSLSVEQLQQLHSLVKVDEYNDIAADTVQITVKHVNTETQRQAMLHDLYIADDK